jgi:hypothetical protein
VHVRPSPDKRREFVETLAGSEFTDLLDLELARIIVDRIYQRAFIEPLLPSIDVISMTTCLAVAGWRLRNRWALVPRDRFRRADAAYRGLARGMRIRRFRVYDWVRTAPPETTS